jgi:hypothetical protein
MNYENYLYSKFKPQFTMDKNDSIYNRSYMPNYKSDRWAILKMEGDKKSDSPDLLGLAAKLEKRADHQEDVIDSEVKNRISRMSDSELDAAKKAALAKRETDLDVREKAVKAREQKAARVEQDLDVRLNNLPSELKTLEKRISAKRDEVRKVEDQIRLLRETQAYEINSYADMVEKLKLAVERCTALEAEYGILGQRAEEFVDQALFDYFEKAEEE